MLFTDLSMQFTKFAGVGAIGTIGHYAVLVALVHLAGLDPVLSSGAGALVGAVINYVLNYKCTFHSDQRHVQAAPKFVAVAAVGLVVNVLMMALLVDVLGFYYLVAQVIATGVVLVWNFLGNRYWTFRRDLAVR